jgi:O-antigen/teichoic acid export membrane protein
MTAGAGNVSFNRRLIANLLWQFMAVMSKTAASIVALSIIARYAGPETMGLFGIAWVLPAIFFAFAQNGAAQGLILVDEATTKHISGAFYLTAAIAIVGALFSVIAGPLIAKFYRQPELEIAFYLAALFIPAMVFGVVDTALAQRELDFKAVAWVQSLSSLCASVFGVIVAIAISPLIGLFAIQGSMGLFQFALWRLIKPRKFLRISSWNAISEIWRHGRHLSLNALTATLLTNAPQLIIGFYLPIHEVGLFTIGRRILDIINAQIGGIANQVMFPTYAAQRDNLKAVGQAYLKISAITAMIMMLPVLALASDPTGFLVLFGGSKWAGGADILIMFLLMQCGLALGQNIFSVMQAVGMVSTVWRWNLFLWALQCGLIFAFGLANAKHAAAMMALSTLTMPLAAVLLQRRLQFDLIDWWRNMARSVIPALVLFGFAQLPEFADFASNLGVFLRFMIKALVLCSAYAIVMVIIEPSIRRLVFDTKR